MSRDLYRSSSQKSVRCVYCVVDFLRDFYAVKQ